MALEFYDREAEVSFVLHNDDYGKVVSFYRIDALPRKKVVAFLEKKYIAGELERTVAKLRRY
jgi:hypothetical protein